MYEWIHEHWIFVVLMIGVIAAVGFVWVNRIALFLKE